VVLGVVVVLALAATWASQRVPTGLLTLADLGWLLPFLAAGYYGCRISLGAARLPTLAKAGIALLALLLLWLAAGTGPVLSLTAGNGVAGQLLSHSIRYALAAAGIATHAAATVYTQIRRRKATHQVPETGTETENDDG